jgi:cobalt-zinc-cadmium efflux system protein
MAGHDHARGLAAGRRRLLGVLALTLLVLCVEVVGGLLTGSLALLADAGHMATDVAGFGMALLASWLAARPATSRRTFGYYRTEVLAAGANGVLLLGVAVLVLVQAWLRLHEPRDVAGPAMLAVALVGLAANGVSLRLLRGHRDSMNLRGAYLEVLGDLLGSGAAVVAGAVVSLTGVRAADPIASVLIALLIVPRAWNLLAEAVGVLLEATPKGVDLGHVRAHILAAPGVDDVHDLHAWTITSGMHAVSAHVVLAEGAADCDVLDALGHCLAGHFDIEHSTFQLESPEHHGHEGATHA